LLHEENEKEQLAFRHLWKKSGDYIIFFFGEGEGGEGGQPSLRPGETCEAGQEHSSVDEAQESTGTAYFYQERGRGKKKGGKKYHNQTPPLFEGERKEKKLTTSTISPCVLVRRPTFVCSYEKARETKKRLPLLPSKEGGRGDFKQRFSRQVRHRKKIEHFSKALPSGGGERGRKPSSSTATFGHK